MMVLQHRIITVVMLAISSWNNSPYCSPSYTAKAFQVVTKKHRSSFPSLVSVSSSIFSRKDTMLHSTKQSRKSEEDNAVATFDEEETPAGIEGAQFFGGNKQKEELYDPAVEERAAQEQDSEITEMYDKFEDEQAFPGTFIQSIAKGLQSKINNILYIEGEESDENISTLEYSDMLDWQSCFPTASSSPLQELEKALEFYRRVDVAIISGKRIDTHTSTSSTTQVQLEWQISVLWPIYWEPRVLLTGNSVLTIVTEDKAEGEDNMGGQKLTIIKQMDQLEGSDVLNTIRRQILPRFWDTYHIGMTPSAEFMTRTRTTSNPLAGYDIYEIPSRLVLSPTQVEPPTDREDRNAQTIPNHAFSTIIKTVGAGRQRYVAVSPTQVQIRGLSSTDTSTKANLLQLKWSIPLSVEFQSNMQLALPGPDPEIAIEKQPECRYEFQQRRRVATLRYGGDPQDDEIAEIRKKLYDKVVKDGFQPRLDESGRPQFIFLQNGVKACFTNEGLGMCVYEFRPQFVKPNEVGLELEF